MKLNDRQLWERFRQYYSEFPGLGLAVDISRMNFPGDFLQSMKPRLDKAFRDMTDLERGAIANPDENRMVGHYWLRSPEIAPTLEIQNEIRDTIESILSFASRVHNGEVAGANGPFLNLLVIGIGGSALGPQFVSHALGSPTSDRLRLFFFDNTDPDGMARIIAQIGPELGQTLCLVISKSGGTKETRNGMLVAKAAYERVGLTFSRHAVAVTGSKSDLDRLAERSSWVSRFPMWDWVGGRTSVTSAVGLLPAALQGIPIEEFLSGARACDAVTRVPDVRRNPAAQLALMWYYVGNGKGEKDMVVLPYKDRLELFSKYLQQLLMESLGKRLDLDGRQVNQGIAVYGNKGSTDQHAYVQQLRDGINNFFVTFIEVLSDGDRAGLIVEPSVTTGDYLSGFLQGTRRALYESDRESITITILEVSPFSIGVLIALFERAVGIYASLANLNAYHQPGVEAGKKAAEEVIELQCRVLKLLHSMDGVALTVGEISESLAQGQSLELVFKICEHLVANPTRGIDKTPDADPFEAKYHAR